MLKKKIVVQIIDEYWGEYSVLGTVEVSHVFTSVKKAFRFARAQAELIGKAGSRKNSKSKEIAQERLAWKRRKLIVRGTE